MRYKRAIKTGKTSAVQLVGCSTSSEPHVGHRGAHLTTLSKSMRALGWVQHRTGNAMSSLETLRDGQTKVQWHRGTRKHRMGIKYFKPGLSEHYTWQSVDLLRKVHISYECFTHEWRKRLPYRTFRGIDASELWAKFKQLWMLHWQFCTK